MGRDPRSPAPAQWSLLCSNEQFPLFVFFENMSKVQVNNAVVLDYPPPFYSLFQFTFECIEDLSEGE